MSAVIKSQKLLISFFCLFLLAGCSSLPSQVSAPRMASPAELAANAPVPIQGNSGQYMSPYTSDGVLAEWVDKAVNAKMGAAIGSAAGAYAGRKALEHVPFIGGFLGQKVGNAAGRTIAIKASGGMEYIKATSDLSFHTMNDLAVYMYANYGGTENYQSALEATWELYPELKQGYFQAITSASRRAY